MIRNSEIAYFFFYCGVLDERRGCTKVSKINYFITFVLLSFCVLLDS
jgi:hypothetical protein